MKRINIIAVLLLITSFICMAESSQERWDKLSSEKKQQLRERYKRWSAYSKDKKEIIKERYKRFQKLNPSQKRRLLKNYKRYKSLNQKDQNKFIQHLKAKRTRINNQEKVRRQRVIKRRRSSRR